MSDNTADNQTSSAKSPAPQKRATRKPKAAAPATATAPKKRATRKPKAAAPAPAPKKRATRKPKAAKGLSAEAFLNNAAGHISDRASVYDKSGEDGERSMEKTVRIFNILHEGVNLTEAQGWELMGILKSVRQASKEAFHMDSADDKIAYAALEAEARSKSR